MKTVTEFQKYCSNATNCTLLLKWPLQLLKHAFEKNFKKKFLWAHFEKFGRKCQISKFIKFLNFNGNGQQYENLLSNCMLEKLIHHNNIQPMVGVFGFQTVESFYGTVFYVGIFLKLQKLFGISFFTLFSVVILSIYVDNFYCSFIKG